MGIYNCEVCDDTFLYQQDVEKHLQLQHDPELRMHTELVHQDENPPLAGHQYDVDEEEDLVSKLKKLKEAVVPLKVKIREGNAWPELREKLKESVNILYFLT